MTKCPICGKRNRDENKFCGECGTDLSEAIMICRKCGKTHSEGEKFCTDCGERLITQSEFNEIVINMALEKILREGKSREERIKSESETLEKFAVEMFTYKSRLEEAIIPYYKDLIEIFPIPRNVSDAKSVAGYVIRKYPVRKIIEELYSHNHNFYYTAVEVLNGLEKDKKRFL